jgi:glutathione S-transferase
MAAVMDELLLQPAIRAWAAASVVLALKTMAVGTYTSTLRIRKRVYISPEDYEMQGHTPAAAADADVERARRIHQNDLENHLPFALVGLVYALTGPSSLGLWLCFAGFPLARILHSIAYARALMPHRTIAFTYGYFVLLWMSLASLYTLFLS